jgi:hypothetical protein
LRNKHFYEGSEYNNAIKDIEPVAAVTKQPQSSHLKYHLKQKDARKHNVGNILRLSQPSRLLVKLRA